MSGIFAPEYTSSLNGLLKRKRRNKSVFSNSDITMGKTGFKMVSRVSAFRVQAGSNWAFQHGLFSVDPQSDTP